MPHDQMLLTVLGFVVFANVFLLGLIPLAAWRQRRSARDQTVHSEPPAGLDRPHARPVAGEPSSAPMGLPGRPGHRSGEDARAAAAIEAFVAGVSPDTARRARSRRPDVVPGGPEATPRAAEEARAVPLRPLAVPAAGGREESTTPDVEPAFRTPERTPARFEGPAGWDRTLREESARHARFRRPVTVVIAELRQLDGVVERLGRQAADRIVSEIAHLMLTEGRSVDRMARLGDGRFGLLLLETDEIAARGYIDRLQAAADGWLESAGLSIRLSLGWAGATEAGDVASAAAAAYQRMAAVDRRPASEGGDI